MLKKLVRLLKSSLSQSQFSSIKRFLGYFLSYKKLAYSQYGEDLFLQEFFKDKNDGFFVDVGAYHPKQFSNTYALYQKGWRGINVDGNPGSMKMFNSIRCDDANVEALISDKEETVQFASWGQNSENTADPGQIQGVARNELHAPDIYQLKTVRLDKLVDKYLPAGRSIDLLSVDVEGMDLKVLKSFDWSKHRPTVVIVETFDNDIAAVTQNELYKFMVAQNYSLVSWYYRSLFFKKQG